MCGTKKETAGVSRRFYFRLLVSDHCSSFSTLCCDWLAMASAETAIDWRVDSAWLLAASSLVSASVRWEEPVCSTLIRFLLKSWRICTTDRFEPSVDASERSVELAEFSAVNALLAELLSRKSVPWVRFERPRPARLKVTPVMLSVDFPVSLNVSFKVSPFNRLTPLNEASWAVVLIWFTTSLYCATRLFRLACEFGSGTGPAAVATRAGVAVLPVNAPIVEEAASVVVTMVVVPG